MSDRIRAIRFDLATMKHMPRFRRQIAKEKNNFIDGQIEHYKRNGRLSDAMTDAHAQNLTAIFKDNYARIMKSAADATPATIEGVKSSHYLEIKLSVYENALFSYFTKYGGEKIKDIAKTTRKDINKLIVAAFESGEPETDVIKAGLKAKALSAYRADTIARTETHQAAAFASRYTADTIARENDLTLEKKWQPTLDERTRPDHMAMSSSDYIDMDQPFNVGGELLDTPGDPNGSPEQIINCRCTELRRVVRDYL